MTTHAIVELLEPVRRGRTFYAAGHQFERLSVTRCTATCWDSLGRCLRIENRKLHVVCDAPPPPLPPATLAEIVRRGLIKPALEVLEAIA